MQHVEYFNVVIDSPTGAGKSTITKLTAKRLGFVYVNTGAIYRSMVLYFIGQSISPEGEEAVAEACGQVEVIIRCADGIQQVVLNGEDVSGLVRSEEIGRMAPTISVYRPTRERLAQLQKQLAREADVVVDGRDVGTYMLPGTPAKIYLTASAEIRTRRRFRKLEEKGAACDIREIEKDIEERDYRDMHRGNSPLRQTEDTVLPGFSYMTIKQVVGSVTRAARE